MIEERNWSEFRFVSTGFPDKTGIGHIVDNDVVPDICAAGNVNRKAPAPKVFLHGDSVNRQWIWQAFFKWNGRGYFYYDLCIAVSFLNNNALFKIAITVWIWWVVFFASNCHRERFLFQNDAVSAWTERAAFYSQSRNVSNKKWIRWRERKNVRKIWLAKASGLLAAWYKNRFKGKWMPTRESDVVGMACVVRSRFLFWRRRWQDFDFSRFLLVRMAWKERIAFSRIACRGRGNRFRVAFAMTGGVGSGLHVMLQGFLRPDRDDIDEERYEHADQGIEHTVQGESRNTGIGAVGDGDA